MLKNHFPKTNIDRLINIWYYSCFKLSVTQLCTVPELSHLETTPFLFCTLASTK